MALNVLTTMVGAQTSPGIIRAIKENGEREIHLVGVDPVRLIPGAHFVDNFYQITPSFYNEEQYVDELINIAKKEDIDVILPCGNEDCLAISKNLKIFNEEGIKVITSPYEILLNAFDKYHAYDQVSRCSPANCPESYLISNIDQFYKYSDILGYPEKKLVVKPRHGRGGRGVYILDPDVNLVSLLSEKPSGTLPYDVFSMQLERALNVPEFLLMEYLPGDVISVYSLCDDGKSLVTIPNKRIWGTASNTLIGEVVMDDSYIKPAMNICQQFSFMYNINMEMKISDEGIPKVFDINPRIAASTAIFRSFGYNLPYFSIKMALGESLELPPIHDNMVMMRYLHEIFYKKKGKQFFEV